jgi:hypothetical protein
VAKKLSDLKKEVDDSTKGFSEYLESILEKNTLKIIENLSKRTNLFIFSGVIRNYFLGTKRMRDIDIVLEKPINIMPFFKKSEIKENSFGGYKIFTGKIRIDLWFLENTWALKYQKKIIDIPLDRYIPYTAFFNFSAVIYSFKEKKFYYHKAFLSFLRDKEISYVFKPNANTSLCIINTFYYADKYKLRISNKLMRYVVRMHRSRNRDYNSVQKKHFGEILYNPEIIEQRISDLSKQLVTFEKKRLANKKKLSKELGFPLWLSLIDNK